MKGAFCLTLTMMAGVVCASDPLSERYVVPTYVMSEKEKEGVYVEKPKMVESGYFDRLLCEAYGNCTNLPPVDEQAVPYYVETGDIDKMKRRKLREKMREALLMRWESVSANMLTDLDKQKAVCQALDTLQPIADLVISAGTDADIADATRLFALVCPRVKKAFPHHSLGLDCQSLHAKVVEYSKHPDVDEIFDIGRCCNCRKAEKQYAEMSNMLDRQHAKLERAFERGKKSEPTPLETSPDIVDVINSTDVRVVYTEQEMSEMKRGYVHPDSSFRKSDVLIVTHDASPSSPDGGDPIVEVDEEGVGNDSVEEMRMKAVSEKTRSAMRALRHGKKVKLKRSAADIAMTKEIAASAEREAINADNLVANLDKEMEVEMAELQGVRGATRSESKLPMLVGRDVY